MKIGDVVLRLRSIEERYILDSPDRKSLLLLLYQILCDSDQRFFRYKLQKFGDFPIYCTAKWAGAHNLFSNMATTIKAEEILQNLNGYNLDISKFMKLKF